MLLTIIVKRYQIQDAGVLTSTEIKTCKYIYYNSKQLTMDSLVILAFFKCVSYNIISYATYVHV